MLFNNIEKKNYFQNFNLIPTHKGYKMELFLKYRVLKVAYTSGLKYSYSLVKYFKEFSNTFS